MKSYLKIVFTIFSLSFPAIIASPNNTYALAPQSQLARINFEVEPLWSDARVREVSLLLEKTEGNSLPAPNTENEHFRHVERREVNNSNIDLYEHKATGLRFYRKRASSSLEDIKTFQNLRLEGMVPILWAGELTNPEIWDSSTLRDSAKCYIELDLTPFGYVTFLKHTQLLAENAKRTMRRDRSETALTKLMEQRSQVFLRQLNERAKPTLERIKRHGFSQMHPHNENFMINRQTGEIMLIDWKYLRKETRTNFFGMDLRNYNPRTFSLFQDIRKAIARAMDLGFMSFNKTLVHYTDFSLANLSNSQNLKNAVGLEDAIFYRTEVPKSFAEWLKNESPPALRSSITVESVLAANSRDLRYFITNEKGFSLARNTGFMEEDISKYNLIAAKNLNAIPFYKARVSQDYIAEEISRQLKAGRKGLGFMAHLVTRIYHLKRTSLTDPFPGFRITREGRYWLITNELGEQRHKEQARPLQISA